MSTIDFDQAVDLVQILCGLLILVLGIPGVLLQVVRRDIKSLIERKFKIPRQGKVIIIFFGFGFNVLIFCQEIGLRLVVAKILIAIVFVLSASVFLYSLSKIRREAIADLIVDGCRPGEFDKRGFRFDLFAERVEDLKELALACPPGVESRELVAGIGELMIAWRVFVGREPMVFETRYWVVEELLKAMIVVVSADGKRSQRGELTDVIVRLGEARDEFLRFGFPRYAESVEKDLRKLAMKIIERVALGRESNLRELIDLCLERFRDSAADIFLFGRESRYLPAGWGLQPAILKLKSLVAELAAENPVARKELNRALFYLIGLGSLCSEKGSAEKQWAEKHIWNPLAISREDVEKAIKFHRAYGNLDVSNALGNFCKSELPRASAAASKASHNRSLFGFYFS